MPVLFVTLLMLSSVVVNAQTKKISNDTMQEKSISCHCYGQIDCYGFMGALGSNFGWPCKTDAHDDQCCDRVKAAYAALSSAQKQTIADCLCAKGEPNGYGVHVYGSVGTETSYGDCGVVATLINKPAVTKTTCTCPHGWLANQTNVDGGVTADGKCKRHVCGPFSTNNLPPNDFQIGTWGFIWGDGIWEWGNTINGGAPTDCHTIVISPAVCKLQ